MKMPMNKILETYNHKAESLVIRHLENNDVAEYIKEASIYSIKAGGKRFRPYLLFSALKSLNVDLHKGISAAAAIEMIHTYSLIHDDLPAMDDDNYRRGVSTNHKVYGEAAAILAGDNLLTESFNILSKDEALSAEIRIELVSIISKAAGQAGMISGQMLDMEAEGKSLEVEELEKIHRHKTGRMISAPIECAVVIADASPDISDSLIDFAGYLGVLFQIRDDILDVTGDMSVTGKTSGSDERRGKSTYVSAYGLDGARNHLDILRNKAEKILDGLSATLDTEELHRVLQMFAVREL